MTGLPGRGKSTQPATWPVAIVNWPDTATSAPGPPETATALLPPTSVDVPTLLRPTVVVGAGAATTSPCGEVAVALPALLLPVTATRSVLPTSAPTGVYVEVPAPPIALQLLPVVSQR